MSVPLICACLWVLASSITAMLPMRLQYVPGLTLLLLAPALLIWIGYEHGALYAFIAVFAVLSLFRRPLMYFARKAMRRT